MVRVDATAARRAVRAAARDPGRAARPARRDGAGRVGLRALLARRLRARAPRASPPGTPRRPRPARRVNASSSVEPVGVRVDELQQRVLAVGADEVVDRRHRLRVGEATSASGPSGTAPVSAVERHQLARPDRAPRRPTGRLPVALRQVDREALVDPARRGAERVVDGRVEHEVDELVRDHDAHPGVVDLVGRDQREQRPDVGVRLAADVLAGARAERRPERRPCRRR